MSDDDDDDNDDSAEEIDGTTYTAFSNTPTRITLTAKVSHPKRKTSGPKVKGEKDKDKKTKRRKRQKQRIPIPEFLPVDEDTNGPWESNCNNRDYYQEIKDCTYSKGLEEVVTTIAQNHVRCIPDGIEQYCKVVEVQRNIKGLVATEDLHKDQFLIKFKGKMMLGSEFDEENQMFRRYNPYVLFYYNNPDCPKLCVDARVHGNEARFIRRSCTPNAEVRHVFQNGQLYLAVFSQIPLPKGVEITIPFEFTYSDYHCSLSCACAQDTCAVAKYKLKYHISGQELNSIAEQNGHRLCDDSSNSSHNPLNASPLRAALSTQNSLQGDSDSDLDNNQDRSAEGESSRRKLSREERKLEAYVKQIERLEKKEKKRQQPQKEHRQAVRVSSDEGTKSHIKSMRCPKRLNHKRRSNGASSGLKKKRPRVSSCSSEPLSPDEVSSSASTPTTPKPVSTIPEEPQHETPSTSPDRNFRFPKSKLDENSQDAVITSALSSPTSPCSPRESETETKPTLSTASSNSDIAMEMEMEDSDNGHSEEAREDQPRDIVPDLSMRLAEIASCASRNECNTPSPCPSSSASPTRSESVMNGCAPTMVSGGRSPGPAPGSPLAALLHGVHSTRSNPLYCSLKKRWLYKFLNSQNGVGVNRPLNGMRTLTFVEKPRETVINHRITTTTTTTTYKEPLPLKKRYLRNGNTSWSKVDTVISNNPSNQRLCDTKPTISINETNQLIKPEHEQQVMKHTVEIDTKTTRTELMSCDTRTVSSASHEVVTMDNSVTEFIGKGTLDTVPDVKPVIINTTPVWQTSDPRQHSPSAHFSSTQQQTSTPTGSTVTHTSSISSGTPGKKKVSLLEYRNRSLQRLSGDGPKPTPSLVNTTTTTPTTPIKPTIVNHQTPIKHSTVTNGPSIEPISPEENERFPTSRLKLSKMTNSPLYEAKLNSLAKKEVGVNMYNKKLSELISEQLLSEPANSPSSSKSPSTASNSPSVPPPPPPPPDTAGKGDAMEIEEDDCSQSDQKIYVTSHIVSPSQPHLPSQPTIITDYGHPHQIPDYRLHDHRAQSSLLTIQQLPSPLSAQQSRVSPYLVPGVSQAIPSQIRFPASYQNPSVQSTSYYQQ